MSAQHTQNKEVRIKNEGKGCSKIHDDVGSVNRCLCGAGNLAEKRNVPPK